MAHHCHAIGCETVTPPRLFMCPVHWRLVSKPLQRAIWQTYQPGQEVTKLPSRAYLGAAIAARNYVRDVELRRARAQPHPLPEV